VREALFRAAQRGAYFPSEEPVGQYQDRGLSTRCYNGSFTPLDMPHQDRSSGPALIVWPYPAGTADCIDRANCADIFVRGNHEYRIVTELGLESGTFGDLTHNTDNLLVFVSFEALLPELAINDVGELQFRGRRCDAMMSELIIGYLQRSGLLKLDPHLLSDPASQSYHPVVTSAVVNGSSYAVHKGLQLAHFAQHGAGRPGLDSVPYAIAADPQQLAEAITELDHVRGMVVRPFSASQGTGIAFVAAREIATTDPVVLAARVAKQTSAAIAHKYGGGCPFPATVTPFVESITLEGCVTDLRVFVVYDKAAGGLRAVPGMVRRAQVPLDSRETLDSSCAMTNLNAPPAPDATPGERIFALADPQTLARLGLRDTDLVRLCRDATAMWASAFQEERLLFAGQTRRQFAYGSVDFLVRPDGTAMPVEMNGANVGSHPTVHPDYLDAFGDAAAGVLENLGLAR
jgi:hypothetical protein